MHERSACPPAGRPHPDPPARGLSGTRLVADDLYLLGHDDRSGKPLLQPRASRARMAACTTTETVCRHELEPRRNAAAMAVLLRKVRSPVWRISWHYR
jgi:hypothetical protein